MKCPQCDYETGKDFHMKKHLLKHSTETAMQKTVTKIYKCNHCDNTCETKQGLNKHIDSIHLGIKYQCSQCEFLGYEIRRHMLIHSEGRHVCDICGHRSRLPKELKYHMLSRHSGKNRRKQRAKAKERSNVQKQDSFCNQCEFKCKQKSYLKQHILTVHEGQRYACDKCDHSSKYPPNLIKHKTMMHQGREEATDSCLKAESERNVQKVAAKCKTVQSADVQFGSGRQENETKYSAVVVVEPAGELQNSLPKELQKISNNGVDDTLLSLSETSYKEKKCLDDESKTEDKSYIESFQVRRFICKDCGSSFLNMNGLKKHIDSMHSEVASSVCSKCSFAGSRAQVNYHFFGHDPNICEECGVTVPGPPATLKYHMLKKHSKSTKKCNECTFEGTFSKFRYHTMFEHQSPRACGECGLKVKHEKALIYHMKSKHAELKSQLSGRKRKIVEDGAIAMWMEKKTNVKLKPKLSDTVVQIKISSTTLEQIEKKIEKKANTWTCCVCNRQSANNQKSDLLKHAEKHIEGLEYFCTMCDKTFSTSVNMGSHYNSTHNVKTSCVIETVEAAKTMNINIEMKYKKRLESMLENRDGLWTCVTCNYSSGAKIEKDRKRKVRDHVEKHIQGDNSCTACGKICRTLSAMRSHCRGKHNMQLLISYV